MIPSIYCKINEFRATFILMAGSPPSTNVDIHKDNLLKNKEFKGIAPILREHLSCFPKANKKLPSWVKANCIFARVPYEQSTAEDVAAFRAGLFPAGRTLSLTGGLGVDDIAVAKAGHKVTSLDNDPCLNALFAYNAEQLGIQNIERYTRSAEDFLADNTLSWDLVFADPDRRASDKRSTSNLADYSPDIFALMRQYGPISRRWAVKLSPMVDTDWLLQNSPMPADVWVISSGSEVKELLLVASPEGQNRVKFAHVKGHEVFVWDGENIKIVIATEEIWFTEPSAGVIKAGFHRKFEQTLGLTPQNTHKTFFTGKLKLPQPAGRSFILMETLEGSLGSMGKRLKQLGIEQANITTRDFVMGAEETRKKLNLKDGGNYYLFFCGKDEKRCFVCSGN